ncbi:MAG TPA: homoserine dehydrogenase [Terriglobales bacterium]|nr:homoserine dehydrogenase [Terriglobales bacterium]
MCLLGFGNVNRALAHLLGERAGELRQKFGIDYRITGIASRKLGWVADLNGMHPSTLLGNDGAGFATSLACQTVRDWLQACQADVLFEGTSLNVHDGQPAIDHIRAALEHGAHAVTANKGPVVFAYDELRMLAARQGRRFLFESAVMDGVPVFSLFRENLPVIHLRGFHGILNSTTNVILSGMEEGLSFDASLAAAQQLGVAETDPSFDIDGWDAAVKVAALAIVLMGAHLKPAEIRRHGIREITAAEMKKARESGKCYKLVCRARRTADAVEASVGPELLPIDSPMAQVSGTSSIIHFQTDIFPGLTITEHDPGLFATAYGMLADFVRAVHEPISQ